MFGIMGQAEGIKGSLSLSQIFHLIGVPNPSDNLSASPKNYFKKRIIEIFKKLNKH